MKKLINFFVRYPAMVNLSLLLIFLVGIISFSQVRYTLDPSEKPKEIYIDLVYRGASPLEIEERVISRIEENLRGIYGMDRFTSVSRENSGRITVELFEWADINELLVEVENAVNRINNFPDEMDRPVIYKQDMLNPTISIALTGQISLQQKKDYARQIRDQFMIEKGISNIHLFGYGEEEIIIELNDTQMDRYGLTFGEIAEAVRKSNIDMTGGELKLDHAAWQIRATSQFNTALEIGQIPVRSGISGQRVALADIADVREQFEDRPTGRYLNGKESVVIQVLTTDDENLLHIAEEVRMFTEEFNTTHSDVKLTIVEDISGFVNERVASLWSNGLAGLVLVLLILTLFLDKRIAFWVSFTIPLSLLGTFIFAMFGYDLTINVVSIFGFILVLGMLVDTGVVVAENIYRHYAEFGKAPIIAARDGAAEVASPMIISLLTTAVAFSLFFFLPGRPGAFFSEISFVVITSLVSALIIAFLFLPAKMTRSKVFTDQNKQTRFERFCTRQLIRFRDQWFMPFADQVSHRWRWLNLVAFISLLIGSVALVRTGFLPVTFFPYLDDDIQLIRMELKPGTPADSTYAKLKRIEEDVYRLNDQISSNRKDGQDVIQNVELIQGPNSHQGRLRIVLLGGEQRGIAAHEINSLFRKEVGNIPEAEFIRFTGATAEQRFGGLPVDISVSGEDLNQLQMASAKLKQKLERRDDLVDVADSDQRGSPELHLELTRAGEQLGLTLQDVILQVRAAFFGMEVQNLQRHRNDVRVWIRFDEKSRSNFEDLAAIKIRTPEGIYPLREVASLYPTEAMLEVNRINGRRMIRVDADLADPSVSAPAILSEIQSDIIPGIKAEYPGVNFVIEGQNRQSGQVIDEMKRVAPVILLLILALIMINFQSFSQTFLVILSLPFAFIGVVIGHMIHGVTMNIFSLIGMIALIGILINNLLVLITAFNDNMRTGFSFEEALKDAVQSRFRPILLTTLSTVAGLTPMIFMGGLASAFLQPPAISIAYGLMFGLLISMTLTPALLVIRNNIFLKWMHLRGKSDVTSENIEPALQLYDHHKKTEL